MARAICRGLCNLDNLDYIENEEAEAKYKYIAEQSAEVICSSLSGFGGIEV